MAPKPPGPGPGGGKKAAKPKRVRRKCSHPSCNNRVVQGGVCVTHGAKRTLCSFPGCAKAVKVAGRCSAHGPARKKCDWIGPPGPDGKQECCTRVAVQGGRCLSHGARRRVCNYPGGGCTKNAIVGGMCKRHYDKVADAGGLLEMSLCVPAGPASGGGGGLAPAPWGAAPAVARAPAAPVAAAVTAVAAADGVAGGDLRFGERGGPALPAAPWGGAAAPAAAVAVASAATAAAAAANVDAGGRGAFPTAPAAAPPVVYDPAGPVAAAGPSAPSPAGGRRRHRRGGSYVNFGPAHHRGLSIFEEMPTVDAIINSAPSSSQDAQPQDRGPSPPRSNPGPSWSRGPTREPSAAPVVAGGARPAHNPPAADRRPAPPRPPEPARRSPPALPARCPPAPPSAISAAAPPAVPVPSDARTMECTGCADCACDACRSPTLAIFDRMIAASQALEGAAAGELDAPELGSPRKPVAGAGAGAAGGEFAETTPRVVLGGQARFLPEEPVSTGSVVMKVSSEDVAEEDEHAHPAGGPHGLPLEEVRPEDAQGHHRQGYYHQDWNASVSSRAVSHDQDDGRPRPPYDRHRQHPPQYHPSRYRSSPVSQHPPPRQEFLETPRVGGGHQVNFLPQEPTSSGSVVRKVSSEDMLDGEHAPAEGGRGREDVRARHGLPPEEVRPEEAQGHRHHQGYHYQDPRGYYYYPHPQEGPASRALSAAAAQNASGAASRTVSQDAEDGRHRPPPPQGRHHPPQAPPQHHPPRYRTSPICLGEYGQQQRRRRDGRRGSSHRPPRHRDPSHRRSHPRAPAPPAFHPPPQAPHPPRGAPLPQPRGRTERLFLSGGT